MEYRNLPDGTKISVIGIGTGNYDDGVPVEEIRGIYDAALGAGVNYLDTICANTKARERIGEIIRPIRNDVVLQMHLCVGYSSGEYERLYDFAQTKESFEEELAFYGTDYADIGTIHFFDEQKDIDNMVETGIIDYARSLREKGIIHNLGVSSHTTAIARKLLDIVEPDVLFLGLNAGTDYEAAEDGLVISEERMELYRECAKRGIAITVMKVYDNNRLLDGRTSPFGKAMSPYQCMQYALDRPGVAACLVGAVKASEMKETLGYFEASPEEKDYSFLGSLTKKDSEGTCTYCNHCQPCPAGIHIAAANRYYDLAKAGDPLAPRHYEALEKHASDCLKCGKCEERCPFHTKAVDRMEEIKQYFGY